MHTGGFMLVGFGAIVFLLSILTYGRDPVQAIGETFAGAAFFLIGAYLLRRANRKHDVDDEHDTSSIQK